ncbi:MAG: hypothetical protein KBC96_12910 [Armatimonadetes bacterium]|nr:hypothetical protein [Armatimonadota bacterium]
MIYSLALLILIASGVMGGPMPYTIASVPEGYHLYYYDDCGVLARQPHVDMTDSYVWTFQTSDTDADLKSRSAVFSYKQVNAVYDDLDPTLDYVVAVTYASDHVYNRVQSLWADGVRLHEPYALPKAKAERLIMRLPKEVTQDGRMKLELKIHGEVNATCSVIEIWASAPPPVPMRLGEVSGLRSALSGRVYDLAYDNLPGVQVSVSRSGKQLTAATDSKGGFIFDRKAVEALGRGDVTITASHDGKEISTMVKADTLFFDPVRYRPIPAQTANLESNVMLLDGVWKVNPGDGKWGDFKVPGQWLQQGYDIPQAKTVAVAHEFTVPKEWAGYRIFLRFDAVHAGTHYKLNGKDLGYSENVFTPVEMEITDAARVGETNRLGLTMTVATTSERLSYSSGYAFHSLGGIDRSVRLYALPKTHISEMRISTDLDKDYRDADLRVGLTVENPRNSELILSLNDAGGKPVELSQSKWKLGEGASECVARVSDPLKWNAEQPNLYRLTLELKQDGKLLERIERNIGFREVEIRGRQLYVNGVRVKLAGACHHEHDPLTGRADTMRHAWEDVRLLRSANLNYLRTSHYPPTQELLDDCDELGVYVEVEAPFCWVQPAEGLADVKEILTPTSAMVDFCGAHPSVIVWSIANESHFSDAFAESNAMVQELDPTRPTTFNHPFSREKDSEVCDIANLHYPGQPYDALLPDDPRPLFLGEYFFPVCHEQTDVMINPGLRELWGMGHSDPTSDFAKACSASYDMPFLKPGARPGVWSSIYDSDRVIGGAIWALIDEPFYLEGGKHAGYAWVHGFWGLIDGWRRPKPEWWLAKLIFSPVWFPERRVEFTPGQESVTIPVENRYSFTNLDVLRFEWEIGRNKGVVPVSIAPASKGAIEIPIPKGTQEGEKLTIRAFDRRGDLIGAFQAALGKGESHAIPVPSGAPKWQDDGRAVSVEGEGYSLSLDKTSGELKGASALMKFPAVHVTRYDFGDLAGPNAQPYADLPDAATRVVEGVDVQEAPEGLKVTIRDHYQDFAGSVTWLIDGKGVGRVSYDYTYSGEEMNTREAGIEFLLKPECDEVKWSRWSEWGIFPEASISRTEGSAKAHRDPRWGKEVWNEEPAWPWSLDETEMGTADFRSIKFNIYEASLVSPTGSGIRVDADKDAHVRPALMDGGAKLHILNQCRMGQVVLRKGDHVKSEFSVSLLK